MKRVTLLGWILGVLCVAAPAMAAPPFGSFGGIVGGGNGGGGNIPLHGWCLDDRGVSVVDIFVDDVIAGRASYGRQRAGVLARYPGFPDAAAAGFAFNLDTTRYHNGIHKVQPVCRSLDGGAARLPAMNLLFTNTTHNLVPFGRIDFPSRNAILYGDCSNFDTLSVIDGWALDAGVEIGDEGMSYVELLIDGSIIGNTRTDCDFDPASGFLYDCLGFVRQDVERAYPGLKDSPRAGWRFAINVGALIDFGFVRGFHVLTARAGDIAGQFSNVYEIPVFFGCRDDLGNEGGFGSIFAPRTGLTYNGVMTVDGWALDREGVRRIEVWLDGEKVGDAFHGVRRPGVSLRYPIPSYPESAAPGFTFSFDTRPYADGPHNVQVFVFDDVGAPRELIGEATVSFNNLPDE